MKCAWVVFLALSLLALLQLLPISEAALFYDGNEKEQDILPEDDYQDNTIDRLLQSAQKRACIRRGGNCDHRPNDCCYNSSCRCNLWGSNCRCQRMGLFQKWG